MKIYVIQNKNGIVMNAFERVKYQMIYVLVKKVTGGIVVHVVVSVIKHVQFLSI